MSLHVPYLAGMDPHVDSCAISLLTLNTFNVDDVFFSVHLDHLADLLSFVMSPDNLNTNIRNTLSHTSKPPLKQVADLKKHYLIIIIPTENHNCTG